MTKIKFGRVRNKQADGTIKTCDIEWYVIHESTVFRKMYRTDYGKEIAMKCLTILPSCNIKLLRIKDLYELVYGNGFYHFGNFCAGLIMEEMFNRSEQEKIMKTNFKYSTDKDIGNCMMAYKPKIETLKALEFNRNLPDNTGPYYTLIGMASSNKITLLSSSTDDTFDFKVEPSYIEDKESLSCVAICPQIMICVTDEEYENLKV